MLVFHALCNGEKNCPKYHCFLYHKHVHRVLPRQQTCYRQLSLSKECFIIYSLHVFRTCHRSRALCFLLALHGHECDVLQRTSQL